jgi:hypothetical protein
MPAQVLREEPAQNHEPAVEEIEETEEEALTPQIVHRAIINPAGSPIPHLPLPQTSYDHHLPSFSASSTSYNQPMKEPVSQWQDRELGIDSDFSDDEDLSFREEVRLFLQTGFKTIILGCVIPMTFGFMGKKLARWGFPKMFVFVTSNLKRLTS